MKRSKGFTLIELLVVIAIIGMLSSVVLASLNAARSKAQDAARIADVKSIKTAIELYHSSTNVYPGAACGFTEGVGYLLGNLGDCLVPTYLSSMPGILTSDGDQYVYRSDQGGGYGLLVYTAAQPAGCITGENLLYSGGVIGWWGAQPLCNF